MPNRILLNIQDNLRFAHDFYIILNSRLSKMDIILFQGRVKVVGCIKVLLSPDFAVEI